MGGAPTRMRFSRASSAGLMLLILFGLAMLQGFWIVANPDLPAEQPSPLSVGAFSIRGNVTDADGRPVPNATVSVGDPAQRNTTTDAAGSYRLDGVPSGLVGLEVRAPPHAGATVRLFLFTDEVVDVRLPSAGAPEALVEHGSYSIVRGALQACGVLILGFGLVAVLGAVACYRRRNWGLALSGAICGLFVLLPVSLVVGGIAVALVSTAKKEFRGARTP